jgi:hypothetical protein
MKHTLIALVILFSFSAYAQPSQTPTGAQYVADKIGQCTIEAESFLYALNEANSKLDTLTKCVKDNKVKDKNTCLNSK